MTTAANDPGSTREDKLLARAYPQIIEAQAERYAAAFDADAGLARFTGWLKDHAAPKRELDADQAVAQLYSMHYRALVRLSTMLVRDTATAEEVVQDAFVAMHGAWRRLGDREQALAYLRQAVVNRSRSVLRHRVAVENNPQSLPPDPPSAEHGALDLLRSDGAVAALRDLPDRQREAILLRYCADLSEAEVAATLGISRGAVKSHTARGMAAIRDAFERATSSPDRPEDSGPGRSSP